MFSIQKMVRVYKRRSQRGELYSKEVLQQAISAVKNGMALKTASNEFGIPRTTLRHHSGNAPPKNVGGQTVLSKELEQRLYDRVLYMCDRGFPCTIDDLRRICYLYSKQLYRRKQLNTIPCSWHEDKRATYEWYYGFKKRFPTLSLRVAENLSAARAEAFNSQRVNTFYLDSLTLLKETGLQDFPNLIYNCDETGLPSVPNSGSKVLAKKGTRCVQKIQAGERGTLTTLIPCANAIGDFIPPFLIFKGGVAPNHDDYPPGTKIYTSKSGYIDNHIFSEFLSHFQEHRVKIGGKKCILFLDGHSCHLSVQALEYAMANEIELVCLPPHSSHRLQPMDTHFNAPLKKLWSKEVSAYLAKNELTILTKYNFSEVFNNVWPSMSSRRGLLVDAFAYCGLYPMKNPIKEKDFVKTYNFVKSSNTLSSPEHAHVEETTTNESSHFQTALRYIMPSPKKRTNPRHTRPHVALVTSPEYVTMKNTAHNNKSRKQVKSYETLGEGQSGMRVSGEQTVGITVRTGKKKTSSTITTPSLNPPPQKKTKVTKAAANHFCCVCGVEDVNSFLEWFDCHKCRQWACENCFSTSTCANC
jgi:hypothetical protein